MVLRGLQTRVTKSVAEWYLGVAEERRMGLPVLHEPLLAGK